MDVWWWNKRKPGPIPKDVVVRRPSYTPTNTPPSSPVPWVDETKNQVIPTADSNQVPPTTTNSTPSVSSTPCVTSPEKLVNGLAEMPTIPVFEPVPVEHTNNHMDAPPTLTPIVNNVEVPKTEGKTEKSENVKNECNKLPLNDCVENSVKVENSVDERLSNHVEEKCEAKVEKEKVLTKKELEDIRRHNLSVRELVYKEVRRRGTNYATLFSHLHQIQGTLDIRLAFLRDIVKESLRFKRRNLASLLEEYLKTIQEDGWTVNHKVNHNGATKIS